MTRSPLSRTLRRPPAAALWRAATSKRQFLDTNVKNINPTASVVMDNKIDGSNADHIELLVKGLEEKHDQLVAFLKSDLDDCTLQQEEALATGLLKLPKSVRTMSVKAFNQKYLCDVLALLKSKDGVVVAPVATSAQEGEEEKEDPAAYDNDTDHDYDPSQPIPSAISSDRAPEMNTDAKKKRCYETPAAKIRPHKPGTVLRTARRGEGLYSKNGSPLEPTEPGTVIATVHKKQRCFGDASLVAPSADVELNVGDGQYVRLNDPSGVSELNAQMKKTAAIQLKVLQDQMASLMAQLKS